MFKQIEKFAYYLVDKYIDGTELEKDKCKYSLYGIFSFIVSSAFALFLSFIFGYLYYLPFIILIISSLRSFSAGSHAKTPRICFLWTNLNYLAVGLSILYLKEYYILYFILSLWCFTKLDEIPKYTITAARHNVKRQKAFKKEYIIRISLLIFINFCLDKFLQNDIQYIWLLDLKRINILISGCLLVNRFSLSDVSFWILEKLK